MHHCLCPISALSNSLLEIIAQYGVLYEALLEVSVNKIALWQNVRAND